MDSFSDGEGRDLSDLARTATLSILQLIPLAGGAFAQVLGDFWTTSAANRVRRVVDFMADELLRLKVDMEAVKHRIENDEAAEVLIVEGLRAAPTTVSDAERQELGNLLARTLSSSEMQMVDARSLLQRWRSIDDIERIMFAEVAKAVKEPRGPSMKVLGEQYFQGATHDQRMLREDFHRRRMQNLMDVGLIRPVNQEAWDAGKYPWRIDHFWPSKIGELLYSMIATAPSSGDSRT